MGLGGYYALKTLDRAYLLIYAAITFLVLGDLESYLFDTNTLNTIFSYRVLLSFQQSFTLPIMIIFSGMMSCTTVSPF